MGLFLLRPAPKSSYPAGAPTGTIVSVAEPLVPYLLEFPQSSQHPTGHRKGTWPD